MPDMRIVAFLLLLLMVAPAAADILQPGTKGIDSCSEIDNTAAFPDYLFIAFPLTMNGEYAIMEPGDCISFYKFASPSFYAVKRDTFNETAAAAGGRISATYFVSDPGVIPSHVYLRGASIVAENSPVTKIVTIFTITSVNATHLIIIPARERITYTDGRTEEKSIPPEAATPTPEIPTPTSSGMDPVTLVLTVAAGSAIVLIVGMRARKR
jgi:hypothetical protein